jgi:hypothetical protein
VTKDQVFVGSLPPGLPFDVPILGDTILLGARYDPDKQVVVHLASGLPPDALADRYAVHLAGRGWAALLAFPLLKYGFVPSEQHDGPETKDSGEPIKELSQGFINDNEGIALRMDCSLNASGFTDVDLHFSTDADELEVTRIFQRIRQTAPLDLLPTLKPPANATMWPTTGGSSASSAHQAAQLTTQLGLLGVLEHFAAQLREHGWSEAARSRTRAHAEAKWTITHPKYGPCEGTLEVTKLTGKHEFTTVISVERGLSNQSDGAE